MLWQLVTERPYNSTTSFYLELLIFNIMWRLLGVLAERQGFEPWVPLTVHTLSKRAL